MTQRLVTPLFFSIVVSLASSSGLSCSSETRRSPSSAATAPVMAPAATVTPVTAPAKGETKTEAQSIELALDVAHTIDGLELVWTAVEDSRCPEDVTCVWAGEVTVHLRVTAAGAARDLVLSLGAKGADTADTEHHRLRLTAVTPYPRSTASVDRGTRRATIEVARR